VSIPAGTLPAGDYIARFRAPAGDEEVFFRLRP
jgi:hypothetical protein